MRSTFILMLSSTLLAAPARTCVAQTQDPALEERIHRVENGLLPPVLAKGVPGWTLKERMEAYQVPGVSIAVFKDFKIDWAKGYGLKDVATGEPVDAKTLFIAGSVSKPVAAMGALRLVQEGKIALDTNINRFLKSWKVPDNEFTKTQKVTLRRLLSHSAGTTVHGFRGYAPGEEVPSLVQILDGVPPANSAPIRVDAVPGSRWLYSGGGTTIVQQAMIDIEGKDFPAIMKRTVLDPLGMSSSSYEQTLTPERLAHAAAGHSAGGAPVPGKRYIYPEMAAAGLWTTPTDLAKFAIEIEHSAQGKSNKVLNKDMSRLMVTPQIAISDGQNMALGLFLDNNDRYFEHVGVDEGFICRLYASKEGGYGAAVMTNSDSPGQLIREIMRSIAKEYGWEDYLPKEHELIALDAAELGALQGRYRLGSDGLLSLRVIAGRLMCSEVGASDFELLATSEGVFIRRDRDVTYFFSKFEQGVPQQITVREGKTERDAERVESGEKVPLEYLLEKDFDRALEAYRAVREADSTDPAVSEGRLNRLGYYFLRSGSLETAVDVFRVNVALHPASFDVYDSLGEAYAAQGQKELAIKNYEKSVELNPQNANGIHRLEKLRKQ
jgi:CubicO group peptidase (beta-lactamase class C family)